MLYREDMLELTRRMTPERSTFTRVAGCYMDEDGEDDGTFNVNFLNLKPAEKKKQLDIARAIPFSETNHQLLDYEFPGDSRQSAQMGQLLMALIDCGLKNDALLDDLYELIAMQKPVNGPYAIEVFHNRYDVPLKGKDKEDQWESEETYEFMILAICPLAEEYEPKEPVCGFLYPSFANRSCDWQHLDFYEQDPTHPHRMILEGILGLEEY